MSPRRTVIALLCFARARQQHRRDAAAKTVGACVVLTRVRDWQPARDLFESLADAGLRRCVVTDEPRAARASLASVVDDVVAAPTHADAAAAEPELWAAWNGTANFPTVAHRLIRILAYARPPYATTLYLDDDTYACPLPGDPLGKVVERLAARAPVRLAERWLAQGEATLEGRGAAAAETQRVVDAFVEAAACGGEAECADAAAGRVVFRRGAYDLQGGVVLLRRSPAAARWAAALRRAYADAWTAPRTPKKRGTDQPALDLAAARLEAAGDGVAALPTTMNFKIAPWCSRDGHDGGPRLKAAHVVLGPVRVLHHKGLEPAAAKRLCRAANARSDLRVVRDASKCGLNGRSSIAVEPLAVERRRPLPVLFSVDDDPEAGAALMAGLRRGGAGWCHVPIEAPRAWDFALVSTKDASGANATHVHRIDEPATKSPSYAIRDGLGRFTESRGSQTFAPLDGYKIACSDFHVRALRCVAAGARCHPCLGGGAGAWAVVLEEDTRFNGTAGAERLPGLLRAALDVLDKTAPGVNKVQLHGHPRTLGPDAPVASRVVEKPWRVPGYPSARYREMNVFEDSHAYAIRRDHAAEVARVADALSRGAAAGAPPTCANPWYDADPAENTCSLDPSLLYGAFGACPAKGSTCRGLALGDADSYVTVLHNEGADHRAMKRLRPGRGTPPRRFATFRELEAWVASGAAAAWRRSEAAKHLRRRADKLSYKADKELRTAATAVGG